MKYVCTDVNENIVYDTIVKFIIVILLYIVYQRDIIINVAKT